MKRGTFALDELTFGGGPGSPIRVVSFDPGSRTVIHRDAQVAGTLGRLMGSDDVDAPEWLFELAVEDGTDAALYDAVGRLEAAWQPTDTRWLRYGLPGRSRRVWGRTRRFRRNDVVWWDGVEHMPVDATFQLADPRHFDDVPQTVDLSIVPASVGGLEAPLVAPLSTVRSSAPRAGVVDAKGDAPAPVTVTFKGPITAPWVAGPGWQIGLTGTLAYDQTVTVDALAATATLTPGGASVGGRLSSRTRLRDAALRPGRQELTFGGDDITGTATATVTWRDAWWSL